MCVLQVLVLARCLCVLIALFIVLMWLMFISGHYINLFLIKSIVKYMTFILYCYHSLQRKRPNETELHQAVAPRLITVILSVINSGPNHHYGFGQGPVCTGCTVQLIFF